MISVTPFPGMSVIGLAGLLLGSAIFLCFFFSAFRTAVKGDGFSSVWIAVMGGVLAGGFFTDILYIAKPAMLFWTVAAMWSARLKLLPGLRKLRLRAR
jgi:hypothetical protein